MRSYLKKDTPFVPHKIKKNVEAIETFLGNRKDINEFRKKYGPLSERLKETFETPGWKEAILPFLERNGNPAKLFGMDPETRKKEEPKIEAYYKLLLFINNLSEIGLPEEGLAEAPSETRERIERDKPILQ